MFDAGFTELLLIGVVALVVIGPERLPAVARTVGQYVGKLQRFVTGVKRDIRSELESGELKDLLGDQKQQIDELRKMVDTTRKDLETGTREVMTDAKRQFAEIEASAKASSRAGSGASSGTSSGAGGETRVGPVAPPSALSLDKPIPIPEGDPKPASLPTTDRVPGAPVALSDTDAH